MTAIAVKLWLILLLATVGGAPAAARQIQLPPESALPGEKVRATQTLPHESALPGQLLATRQLPSESMIPAADALQPDIDNGQVEKNENEPDAIKEFSQRPILRLQGEGPVADLKSIRFSLDGKRIFAGGLDKTLHVWQRLERRNPDRQWGYEKSVPWQINRATQGQIFSVAVGEQNIVFAGVGASASNGEIVMLDNDRVEFSQALVDVENGHTDSIFALATDSKNRVVASIDIAGRTIAWRRDLDTGKWIPQLLRATDTENFGAAAGASILEWRSRGGSVAISESLAIVYPEISGRLPPGTPPNWHLVRVGSDGSKSELTAPEVHRGSIVAITCSNDGQRVVSADLRNNGRLFFWDLDHSPLAQVVTNEFPVRCLDLSADGTRLLIGTARNAQGVAQTQVMDWAKNQTITKRKQWQGSEDVQACALSPDGKQFAFARGAKVMIGDLQQNRELQTLDSKILQASRVAFSANAKDYRCILRSELRGDKQDSPAWSFNPEKLNLVQLPEDNGIAWVDPNPQSESWKLKRFDDPQTATRSYSVEVGGQPFCKIPLNVNRVGDLTTGAFVADPNDPQTPLGLIVGTSGKNHLYAFRIGINRCELVREYRGHTAAITSVGVSADSKYIVSSASDGTTNFWKLSGSWDDANWQRPEKNWSNRWGAELSIVDGRLRVAKLIEDGPLYFRGVRQDDVIEKITWSQPEGARQESDDPAVMRQHLETATTDRLTQFNYSRAGVAQPYFYLYPAWQPLASFAWDRQREWAFWTPYGFYDASFNGHKIFGWQINQGVNRPIKYFRAAELKEELERPKMMQNLLSVGSVESAFEVAHLESPQNLSQRLSATSRLKPDVKIIRVTRGQLPENVTLTAAVQLADGVELGRIRAYANGVPSVSQTQIPSSQDLAVPQKIGQTIGQTVEFEFRFELPHDRRIKLQVLAASQLGHGAMAETMIDGPPGPPAQPPRIFVMALGVSKYQDSQIPQLDFAHLNAETILKQLSNMRSSDDPSILLTDRAASKSMWIITSRSLAEEMKQIARPDDLFVVFLSGHGFRDPVNQSYFYLTAASKYSDVLSRRYGDCISFDELSAFGEIACRKLVILDTCHSGSLQTLRQQNLKSIVRTLENDLFFTLTASEGTEVAFESKERGLGMFTARLIDSLAGQADLPESGGKGDGVVTLLETVNYLQKTVPQDAARIGNYQFPTASPADLLELAEINLGPVGRNAKRKN